LEKIIINDARSQYGRLLEALQDGYVRVDEYTQADLMAFAVEFSGLINYFNTEDRVEGDWMGFFLMDNAFLLSYIASTDIKRIEEKFEQALFNAKNARQFPVKFKFLREVFEHILFPARLFNLFLKVLDSRPAFELLALKQELVDIIKPGLSQQLRKLKSWDEGAASKNALDKKIGLHFHGFLPIWNIQQTPPDDSIFRGRTMNQKIDCALTPLRSVFETFIYQLAFIKQFAENLLPDALAGPHKPHVALYLSFLKLYGSARDQLNTITDRYRDFYYTDVLRQKKRPYTPDNVYLSFTMAEEEGVTNATIGKGSLFLAGADENGQDILYAANKDLSVGKTAINRVYTVFTRQGPLIQYAVPPEPPGCGCTPVPEPITAVTGLYAGDYLAPDEAGDPVLPVNGFATMGNDHIDTFNQYATAGFTIASDALLLTGGDRDISFTFLITGAAQKTIAAALLELSQATGKDETDLLKDILQQAFNIYLSTENEWLKVDGYTVSYNLPADNVSDPAVYPWGVFKVSFTLPFSAPGIMAFRNEATGEPEGLPTAKFILRQEPLVLKEDPQILVYPISILHEMRISQVLINANVQNFGNFSLRNNESDIDTSTPFNPFGSIPVKGSYVEITGGELFSKRIDSLSIQLEWFDLPQNKKGFCGYYKYYKIDADGNPLDPPIDNDSFRVKIYTVHPGSWELKYPGQLHHLFSTQGAPTPLPPTPIPPPMHCGRLCPTTSFDALPVSSSKPPDYYVVADSRLRIELSEPDYGFGSDLYAINLMKAVINDLPPVSDKELEFPLPPYTPSAASLLVHYSCSAILSFDAAGNNNNFFHILPFDGYQPVREQTPTLLPSFNEGNLILGFSGWGGAQTLSLLFSMSSPQNLPGATDTNICWSYLSDNRWVYLSPSDMLSDGTNHFRNTGIISLKFPSFPIKDNTLLPSDLTWIRATTKKNALQVAPTLGLYPHALTATWQNNDNTATHLQTPLPAFTIREAVTDIGDIQNILQPLASFGGRPAETDSELIIRTGERLNHKQRAVLPQDYERLVLEQFPQVYKVKCLPHHSRQRSHQAGHVLVVVVQGPNDTNRLMPQTPVADPATLTSIKNYLAEYLSPFITLDVCNPVYVQIKVNCTVQFVQGIDAGKYIDQLNQDLILYLSPWYYDQAREAKAGNYVSPADISGFIQTRPYIAFLDTVRLDYDPLPGQLETGWYFLTSAAGHDIKEFNEQICEP